MKSKQIIAETDMGAGFNKNLPTVSQSRGVGQVITPDEGFALGRKTVEQQNVKSTLVGRAPRKARSRA